MKKEQLGEIFGLPMCCMCASSAAWLYDLLKPHVTEVLVCNPRKNAALRQGNKSDKIDARKLAERLRLNDLKPFYHGETGVQLVLSASLADHPGVTERLGT